MARIQHYPPYDFESNVGTRRRSTSARCVATAQRHPPPLLDLHGRPLLGAWNPAVASSPKKASRDAVGSQRAGSACSARRDGRSWPRAPEHVGSAHGSGDHGDGRHGASPSVMIFECNRSITGMALERTPPDAAHGSDRPMSSPGASSTWADPGQRLLERVTVEAPPNGGGARRPGRARDYPPLRYYGDEAGWSPDALRAIGVEPVLPPEPAAE